MRLENKIVIITGAASGIGKEIAMLFVKEGAKVVVADVNQKGGEELVTRIKDAGGDGFFAPLDVSDREQSRKMVEATMEKYGKIDVLINNAGITQDAFLSKMTVEQWDRVIEVDLTGVFNCIQAVVGVMLKQENGVIINASSISGLYGNIGQINYASAKAGLIGMTKSLAKELGKKGIRVNAIAPGFIVTPMTAAVPSKVLEMMREKTPLRRLGETMDVAYAYLYLASEEASFVNGAVLCVDGGLTL